MGRHEQANTKKQETVQTNRQTKKFQAQEQ
jgi:hypothetical protein